jgi:hypothetical protein
VSERCAELSRAAGESLGATAVTAEQWLLVEVPGTWPRDVADEGPLPSDAARAVARWLRETPRSRLHFVRRPGRAAGRPVAFAVHAPEGAPDVRRIELRSHSDLSRIDLATAGERVEGSLVLVCGHGSRDQCCALRGTAVFAALSQTLREEELWISSHQGGHRFAANVLVLPAGVQFGRVEPDEARFLVARALAGRIELERYRGRTCYEPAVQAAELAVRQATGLEGVSDLRLEGVDDGVVRFRTWTGAAYSAAVEEREGPLVPASCGVEPSRQRSLRGLFSER